MLHHASSEIGTAQMTTFVEQILNTKEVKFGDSLPNPKIKTYVTLVKKKTVKMLTVNSLADS